MGASQAASMLGVSRETLNRAADDGKVAVTLTPGGQRRYRRRDIEDYREQLERPRSRAAGEVA
ncbi:helix-turn-helix domain-containing protein [Actinomyces faecalis]|uniref:helix-turn-helix domain-containing protein n=1 Tax=Actinomyces faecalis TaxID=2722820 RepID=UPI0039A47591